MPLRVFLLRVAPVVVVLALVACSSDADDDVDAPSATASSSVVSATATPSAVATQVVAPTEIAIEGVQSDRLLLVEGGALFIQERDGARQALVQIEAERGFAVYPAWSPDGESIAFVRRVSYGGDPEADWGDDLLMVPADGGEPRLLRGHAAKGELIVGVSWQPDSERVLVGRVQVGFSNGIPSRTESAAIVEIDVSSGAERVVLDGAYDPSLSADGARMAYQRLEEVGIPTVMVANADGSAAREIVGSSSFSQARNPRISPDGQLVAFAAPVPIESSMRWDGRGLLGRVLGPLWPRRAEAHGAPMEIWVADVETGEVRQLTSIGADDPYLGWSPDGETVVVIETNGLYEVSISGKPLMRVGGGIFGGRLAVAPE